jgi:hypothetical protein
MHRKKCAPIVIGKNKGRIGKYMNEEKEKLPAEANRQAAPLSSCDDSDRPQTPSRRQLIERYGKYAVVAAPLLLFASKGQGQDIHSGP